MFIPFPLTGSRQGRDETASNIMTPRIFLPLLVLVSLAGCQEINPGMTAQELTSPRYWGPPTDTLLLTGGPQGRPVGGTSTPPEKYEIWFYERSGVDYLVFIKAGSILGYRKYSPTEEAWQSAKVWVAEVIRSEAITAHLEEHLSDIINQRLKFGISREAVRLSWGKPSEVKKYYDKYGNREEWFYQRGFGASRERLVFTNGALTDSGNH